MAAIVSAKVLGPWVFDWAASATINYAYANRVVTLTTFPTATQAQQTGVGTADLICLYFKFIVNSGTTTTWASTVAAIGGTDFGAVGLVNVGTQWGGEGDTNTSWDTAADGNIFLMPSSAVAGAVGLITIDSATPNSYIPLSAANAFGGPIWLSAAAVQAANMSAGPIGLGGIERIAWTISLTPAAASTINMSMYVKEIKLKYDGLRA